MVSARCSGVIHDPTSCPDCRSPQTASRRQLFHCLMAGNELGKSFEWYSDRIPQACPPRSLFVVFMSLLVGMSVPAVILWYMGFYSALPALGAVSLCLLACLLLDVLLTYRRYKTWSRHWVCGSCKTVFQHQQTPSFGARLTVS